MKGGGRKVSISLYRVNREGDFGRSVREYLPTYLNAL